MNITCGNEICNKEFKLCTTGFEIQSEKSGNHTTQYLAEGTAYCSDCQNGMEIKYLYDVLDDTGEILSEELLD